MSYKKEEGASEKAYWKPQTYLPLKEPGKVRRANLHEIEHVLFDERLFVKGALALGGMSVFKEDPTKPKVPLHDASGEETPFLRIPLLRKHGYETYRSVPAVQKNAYQENRPEAFQSSSSEQNARLKKHLFHQQKGLCMTCHERLLPQLEDHKDLTPSLIPSMQNNSSLMVDAREEKPRARLVHATKECRQPWKVSLPDEHPLEESLPQVKFLHDLMARQKLCLKTGKPFKGFNPDEKPGVGFYHNYQVALVPTKFYHARMGRKNLSFSKKGFFPEGYRSMKDRLPEVCQKYLGTGNGARSNAWKVAVLPVNFQHPLSRDSLPLRDFYLWLENGESEALQRLKEKFAYAMQRHKPQSFGSGRKGFTREDHFIHVAVGYLLFYQYIMTHTQGDLSSLTFKDHEN
jgi:hypothetical protein